MIVFERLSNTLLRISVRPTKVYTEDDELVLNLSYSKDELNILRSSLSKDGIEKLFVKISRVWIVPKSEWVYLKNENIDVDTFRDRKYKIEQIGNVYYINAQ
jgi:hypothetical protein